MQHTYVDFELPIVELEAKIDALKQSHQNTPTLDITEEIVRLKKKHKKLTQDIFSQLTAWQITQLARHPMRPYTLDYIALLCDQFDPLHGDRLYADDAAIVGGLATFRGQSIMVIGHQKGRDTKERMYRNFGSPHPEGYRKAKRLMELAERFSLPVVTFIDTPGAYPGIEAEERGQSEAIARNLQLMSSLKTPIIAIVIGEGASGGALGIGVADKVLMLEYSYYSVISPEGCASILFKNTERAQEAASMLGITADRLLELGLINEIIPEPLGGAHRDTKAMANTLGARLEILLKELKHIPIDQLLSNRYTQLMRMS
jgi:acetyl-CoA carboxylase carboxyl transferase subunit alpha